MAKATANLNCRIGPDLDERITAAVEASGLSKTAFVIRCLETFMANPAKEQIGQTQPTSEREREMVRRLLDLIRVDGDLLPAVERLLNSHEISEPKKASKGGKHRGPVQPGHREAV